MPTPICVVGTIATDLRYSQTGGKAALCSFRLASHERRYDREQAQWVDGEVNWFTIVSFRGLAEHARDSFAKGDRVIVNGRLRIRRWETDEKSGTAVEVEADALGHDLRWGVTSFTKRSTGASAVQPVEAPAPTPTSDGQESGDQPQAVSGDGFVPNAA